MQELLLPDVFGLFDNSFAKWNRIYLANTSFSNIGYDSMLYGKMCWTRDEL